jgi:succinate dehydrogenase / fumarate reductase iron-sulfur subunit
MDVPLKVFRYKQGGTPHYDTWTAAVPSTANVLDAIEYAWWHCDSTLMFRHACHHASCGSCAVRVNGRERLPCITPLSEVWDGRGEVLVEPLRNFPVVGDLVVDVSGLFERLTAAHLPTTRPTEPYLPVPAGHGDGDGRAAGDGGQGFRRFEDCVECGICVSACPTAGTDERFFGPAGLAAVHRAYRQASDARAAGTLLDLTDGEHGVWRCHLTWECTAACPQGFEPAESIVALRRQLVRQRLRA